MVQEIDIDTNDYCGPYEQQSEYYAAAQQRVEQLQDMVQNLYKRFTVRNHQPQPCEQTNFLKQEKEKRMD